MKLPLLLSVPHAGLVVPEDIRPYCALSADDIVADGDEGASEIYDIADKVQAYVTTTVARAILDMNRAEDDRRKDGVVKTHTCLDVPVYRDAPPEELFHHLIEMHHRPYHERLRDCATQARIGIDCHTMFASGPPVSRDTGKPRPFICISNVNGKTCPDEVLERFRKSLERTFSVSVSMNDPFRGGHIVQSHAGEIPWIQLELSRAPFLTNAEKRGRLIDALNDFMS